jgi:hypothetical protein
MIAVAQPTLATTRIGHQFTTTQLPTADRHLMVGDDVYVLVSAHSPRSTSMPSGWTLVTSVSGLHGGFKAEVWHYGISSTSTWSTLNATVTLGASTISSLSASAIGLLVRGEYIDPVATTTFTPSSSPAGPSVTYTGSNAYSFGWVMGANYSSSGNSNPFLLPNPEDGPQNGWTGYPTHQSNLEPGHKIVLNDQDTPPAPTFLTIGTTTTYFYMYFSIRYTVSGGWSVGRIKY